MGGVDLYGRPRPLPLAHTLGEHDRPTHGLPYGWSNRKFVDPCGLSGYVYTSGGGDGLVHALRASGGSSTWSYHVDSGPFSDPAVANGVVYVGTASGRVYALRASDGSQLWWYQTGEAVESASTLEDGALYVGS